MLSNGSVMVEEKITITVTQEDLQFCICRNCLRGFISPEIGYRNAFCGDDCKTKYEKYPWGYDGNIRKVIWMKEIPKNHPLLTFS